MLKECIKNWILIIIILYYYLHIFSEIFVYLKKIYLVLCVVSPALFPAHHHRAAAPPAQHTLSLAPPLSQTPVTNLHSGCHCIGPNHIQIVNYRVDAVLMDRWCNWLLVVRAFIVILLLSSLWFIWNNCICHIPSMARLASNIRKLPITPGILYINHSIYIQ